MPINSENSQTMSDLWESFSVEVMRKSSPPISQPELASVRRVFYAGMIGAFSALVVNGSNDEAQAMKQLNAWREEAAEFLGEAKRNAQKG